MPMTKQERDELRAACKNYAPDAIISLGSTRDSFHRGEASFTIAQLRELLDGAERWQAIVKWAQDRVHHENDKTDHYYRGFGSACRAILDRVPTAPAPQGEPEG